MTRQPVPAHLSHVDPLSSAEKMRHEPGSQQNAVFPEHVRDIKATPIERRTV